MHHAALAQEPSRLLTPADPAPVIQFGPSALDGVPMAGGLPFVLVSDHAGQAIPAALGDMGVSAQDRARHIACDLGMAETGRLLAAQLGCVLIEQAYSRLVIDCNRAPGHPTSIVRESDGTPVPANADLSADAEGCRVEEIFLPYHQKISGEISTRLEAGLPVVLVSLHSFTDCMNGQARPWHTGVLHNRNPAFGLRVRDLLAAEDGLVVGSNEPYALTDVNDYTVPVHAEGRGLPYLEIEIRQDLIATPEGQARWAARLARILPRAWEEYRH
ncbi:N-formylglutamate amidohydrolase [Komagataeibacter nataicola]|uniref:N-formylglutamate amidohydrolase n=1 Tax=Komagataeibacter nataicola TaxID=265960 RepID=A0A9N7CCE0_9PROT|nr:N-formylglutamate amidohydrolase [Komagataeibacter nataicola]AQU88507.1 N-formylglutamate amidohydrolase [Komagataeibacter nataicola]PYD67204.1 N-formylglutamate amidohydrolase [Komagataeibacter nataicola]WEQ57297.1 N-formylglutamate amidohydrolase [Komagataeibacter nataicola]